MIVGTKSQLKLTILIFWSKLSPKGYFRSKTEKSNLHIVATHYIKLFHTEAEKLSKYRLFSGSYFAVFGFLLIACNFTKNNTPPWVLFTLFKLYKWSQIVQCITFNLEL